MSYNFTMGFIDMPESEVLDHCLKVADACIESAKEIIDQCAYYMPTLKHRQIPDTKNIRNELDKMWLYRLFNLDFVYWEKEQLLGIGGGDYPKAIKTMFSNWHEFQSSCEQDYEYESWDGINAFEKNASRVQQMSAVGLYLEKSSKEEFPSDAIYKGRPSEDEDLLSDIEGDIDFHKKSFLYETIYEKLDLDHWLYGKEGNFKRFSINAINSQEKHFYVCEKLQEIKNQMER